MTDGRHTPHRLRQLRQWLAAKILGPHGTIRRRVIHEEFLAALVRSSEGAADE